MINPETFIQEFRDLYNKTPQCGSWTRGSENCDYGDIITVSKNSYMCFNSGNCEDAYYCEDSRELKNCIDCGFCETCELCYECVDCTNCYNCNFTQDSANCNDVHFSYDLRRCNYCFGCVGLRDKTYYIFNQQKTKEEYEAIIKVLETLNPENISNIENQVEILKRKVPRMYIHQFNAYNSTGDYIYHSKNCYQCFDTRHSEDSGHIIQANLDKGTKDCWDCGPIPTGLELSYDIAYSHVLFNCKHLYWCGVLNNCYYSTNCFDSENLFGCHYLKGKTKGFYILNQPVDEAYYKQMTKEIIKYLRKKKIYTLYDLLYKNFDEEAGGTPPDNELSRICTLCGEQFEIVDEEAGYCKEHDIELPVYCPTCRAKQRINLRNERKMYKRICASCNKELITTYPEDNEHIVYCLNCYWKHIG